MLDNYKELINSCTICHDQCVFACPTFTVERKTTVYPSRKAQIAHCLLTGEVDWDEDSAELFYHCCGCRQCMAACVYIKNPKDPIAVYHAARYDAIQKGIELDYVKAAKKSLDKDGSLYGDLSSELDNLNKINKPDSNSKILYLADDETLALNPGSLIASVKLMNKVGIKPLISKLINTGLDVKATGFFDIAEEYTKKMCDYLNTQNVDKIIVSNPKAFYAITVWYKELGLDIKANIELETTFLYKLLLAEHEKLVSRPNNIPNFLMLNKVGTYQDGSFMARYLMDYENPRRLVKPLFRHYKELWKNRKEATPAAPAYFPLGIAKTTLEGMAKLRIIDIEGINADYVITSDPLSYDALRKYWNKDKVLSISEVLLMNYVPNAT